MATSAVCTVKKDPRTAPRTSKREITPKMVKSVARGSMHGLLDAMTRVIENSSARRAEGAVCRRESNTWCMGRIIGRKAQRVRCANETDVANDLRTASVEALQASLSDAFRMTRSGIWEGRRGHLKVAATIVRGSRGC